MSSSSTSLLAEIEPHLRLLLPADLYALAWVDPSPATLTHVFRHLRTLHRIMHDYVSRQVSVDPPKPGEMRHGWQEGTLLFTDLAGFTPLMEATATQGRAGAQTLLGVLNTYFAQMLEIISMSGGDLLEFTGDAVLAQFSTDRRRSDTAQAVRAGLRMQRAMAKFANIETPQGTFSLRMRVGIHAGRFLTADIGTPRRMEHVLLGNSVTRAKQAEGTGQVGRVCLTETAWGRVEGQFRCEPGQTRHVLVIDDLSDEQLGEYEIAPPQRRLASVLLTDRSVEGLVSTIEQAVKQVEPLVSFLPVPVLNVVVENAARRQIPPDFPRPTILFVNLLGLPEAIERARPGEEASVVAGFSRALALINAAVEARGGILKKVTYHLAGSDMMICFGVPNAHTNDPSRAAETALAIRDVVTCFEPLVVGGREIRLSCQVGMARGPVFVAEIGEPRGRREFNVLGDTVNTAARLMNRAGENQILMTEAVYQEIARHSEMAQRFDCESLGAVSLKGKAAPVPLFALRGQSE